APRPGRGAWPHRPDRGVRPYRRAQEPLGPAPGRAPPSRPQRRPRLVPTLGPRGSTTNPPSRRGYPGPSAAHHGRRYSPAVTDEDAIRSLIARYSQFCDDGRFDEWGELYTDDAVFSVAGRRYEGRDAIKAFIERGQPPEHRGKHVTTNV